jgi:metal-responsive CopG/Arc/MetJ family transcriptional regulator
MATLDSIADEIGYSRNELMQSMVKFGLTNRDWRNEGLTAHKRLPRYQENPGMATKPPSPAQLAARARFAEMARSGSLNRKRQIAAKRKSNPAQSGATEIHLGGSYYGRIVKDGTGDFLTMVVYRSKGYPDDVAGDFKAKHYATMKGAINALMKYKAKLGYATNPAKKTVSQKISQLVHEGYPQRQAVAVALNEQRKGKVKRNPTSGMVKGYAIVCMHPEPHTVAITMSMYEAKQIAQDYATRENVQVAIKPIEVHAGHFA